MADEESIKDLECSRSPSLSIRAGEAIFEQGSHSDYIYNVISGWVSLHHTNREGNSAIIGFALPGDVLPFKRLTKFYNFSAVAIDNVTVCPIHASRQVRLEHHHPEYDALHRGVVEQALDLAETNLAAHRFGAPAEERVANLLWSLAFKCLRRPPSETDRVVVPISQIQIGLATGITPVHVSRTLRALRQAGLLQFDRHMILIHNRAKVEMLVGASTNGWGSEHASDINLS